MARFACSERRVGFGDYWEESSLFIWRTGKLFLFPSLFTSGSDFRRNALISASHRAYSHDLLFFPSVFKFRDSWFPSLCAHRPFFLIVIRVYSMDLHFDPHSLPTLVSTLIMFLLRQTSLSAFPFVYPRCHLLIPRLQHRLLPRAEIVCTVMFDLIPLFGDFDSGS